MNKQKTIKITAIIAITALLAVNIYIFTKNPKETHHACYKDVCLYSQEKDPVEHINQILNTSNESILIFEGDTNKTTATSDIVKSVIEMTQALSTKTSLAEENIHGIGYQNGEPIDCGNHTVQHCQSIQPKQNQVLIHMKYPDSEENTVTVQGRKITIETQSPLHQRGTAIFLRKKFF